MFEECRSGADKMYGFGLFSEIKMLVYFPFYSIYVLLDFIFFPIK